LVRQSNFLSAAEALRVLTLCFFLCFDISEEELLQFDKLIGLKQKLSRLFLFSFYQEDFYLHFPLRSIFQDLAI